MAAAPTISLRPINKENWKECAGLSVSSDQQNWIPGNLYSIAEAQFYPDAQARAIYNPSGQMVGFALYGRDDFTGKWKIFRLMIDQAHQRRGYGQAAMRQIIDELAEQPDGDEILICYHDGNEAARRLYAQLGFVEQSIDESGKVTARFRRD